MTQLDTTTTNPFDRVVDALDANFGTAPHRRAAHAKGVVVTGTFTASSEASGISRAGHLAGKPVDVVARFSNFPGGTPHPDAAPESNPRGLAVQFRLPDGSSTDLLAHSINGFPGRTVEDFSDFLYAIAPGGPGPQEYLSTHAAAASFVAAVQSHGTPRSYAGLNYFPVNAFRFENTAGATTTGRYAWEPQVEPQFLADEEVAGAAPDFLVAELAERLAAAPVRFSLNLTIARAGDVTDDANSVWPEPRRQVRLGTLELTDLAPNSDVAEQGLFFDPVRLVDGITISDDPLLAGRSRTYPISLIRRHEEP